MELQRLAGNKYPSKSVLIINSDLSVGKLKQFTTKNPLFMENDMIIVHRTTQQYEANVIEALLKKNNVDVFLMSKQDSAYPGLPHSGLIDIYVPKKFEQQAKALINDGLAELN